MMREFARGQRVKLSDLTPSSTFDIGFQFVFPTTEVVDVCCFGIDGNDTLSDERYFIFYNQRSSPCGSLVATGTKGTDAEQFRIDLNRLPQHIRRLVFTATLDSDGTMSQLSSGLLRIMVGGIDILRYHFRGSDFGSEKALIVGELYFKDNWRFCAVGQGFAGGLSALLKHFGGVETTEETQQPTHSGATGTNNPSNSPQHASPGANPTPERKQSGELRCICCGKKPGLFGSLSFHKETGRCGNCEEKIRKALLKFQQAFILYTKDDTLSIEEWGSLQRGSAKEGLDWQEALTFVQADAIKFLERMLVSLFANGMINEEQERLFHRWLQDLGVTGNAARPLLDRLAGLKQAETQKALYRFRQLFRDYCQDGILTPEEWQSLRLTATQERLDWTQALTYVRGDALTFLERTLTMAFADGIITEEEERDFHRLRKNLAIPDSMMVPLIERLNYLKRLTEISQGILPTVQAGVMLESDEICHLEIAATYRRVRARAVDHISGRLVATNKQVHFVSNSGGFIIKLKNIMRVEDLPGAINLELSVKNGNGRYDVDDPLLAASIIKTLVRLDKRQLMKPQADGPSRHISREVKLAVWQRDQGKCVQCGARQYLEYDHIIPFSKGGASTESNVQLLCRRCNLEKGDRI